MKHMRRVYGRVARGKGWYSCCGLLVPGKQSTKDKSMVTCKRCKVASGFKVNQ
jgi:hypothetical protein